MLPRLLTLKTIVIFFALTWVFNAEAVIYKWKDTNGKTHFTDDPTKVPEEFRNKPFLKNSTSPKEKLKPEKNEVHDKEDDVSGKKEDAEDEKKEGLTEAQRSTIQAAVNFFKEDISRYDKIYTFKPGRSKFRVLKQTVAGAMAQKKGLLDQVIQHELPLLESVSAFLKTSIAEDEKSQKIATTYVPTRKTRELMNRLKSEAGQEAQLLEKLTTALNAENDS